MNIAYPSLIISSTCNLNLGKTAYRLKFSHSKNNFAKVIDGKEIVDEFGDVYFDANLEVQDTAIPKILYFARSKNDHGFGYWDSIGNGSKFLFTDSWIWLPREEKFTSFEAVGNDIGSPSLFPGCIFDGWQNREVDPVQMVIHSPCNDLVKKMHNQTACHLKYIDNLHTLVTKPTSLSEIEKLQLLFNLCHYCEFVTLWRHGPFRAVLLSSNLIGVMENIAYHCELDGIHFVLVNSESDLPRW